MSRKYLDTSFLVPLVLPEATSAGVEMFLQALEGDWLSTSVWAHTEFVSLTSRKVRMGELSEADALEVLKVFEQMLADSFQMLTPSAADFAMAATFLRNYRTGLRAGDALHLAIAHNQGRREVLSLDRGLVRAATTLGVSASTGFLLPET